MKKSFLLFFSIILLFGIILNAQDKPQKWSEVPQNMWMYNPAVVSSSVVPIGNENFVNTFNTVRYLNSPSGVYLINPNVRVLPRTNSWQSEVVLERHPTNPLIMFGSSNAFNVVGALWISEGVYVTTDGGVTWFGSDTLMGAPINNHGGDPAPTIDKNGNFIITHLGYSTAGMYGNYSTNNGLTWSNNYTIQAGSVDKNLSGTDDIPGSPYYGRSYTVYTTWGSGYPARISYTTNGGVSWSTPTNILTPAPGMIARAEDVHVGPGGVVYTCWANNVGNGPETQCSFAKSTDGGVTFTGTNNAFAMNGLLIFNGGYGSYNIRMNSFPRMDVDNTGGPRNGWIYIVVSQRNLAPAVDDDIILHRSTDGGTTWSAGIRVNQDTPGNGKLQFYNAVSVDQYGGVNVIYYDNRNTSADSAEVMVSRSIDGGTTWTDIVVSHRFKPKPITIGGIAGGYAGDYIGITSSNNKVWPFWMDDISGVYQAWTTSIDLGPGINHTPLITTEQTTGPRAVNAIITPAGSNIDPARTKLYYGKLPAGFTDSLLMTNTGGNNWTQNITLSGPGTYRYYIKTADLLNRVATAPGGAPGYFYSFDASPDTVKPVIVHTPIGNTPKVAWPISCSANVTDNIGIDSVWVYWYKNNTSTAKRFKLLLSSGSTYSALFNSVNADVAVNDSIFYRIIAQDAGSNHKRDSTALYKFKIIQQTTFCIGTGTTAVSNYPFNTFWWGNRTHMLWTAAEIVTAGVISKIAFQVSVASPQSMAGFLIRMQHTSATTVTGFLQSGWTTVYTGTYTVPGTGWQEITLQTPFVYNGTQNLLVDVCFANSSYTSSTSVLGTAASGRVWYYYADVTTACSNAAGSAGTTLPNVCFTIGITGVNNNTSEIPTVYSLSQNYPNPFNPVTQIKYDLPKQGLVTLKIYDVLGREVSKLVNEVKAPGSYIVDFDGTNISSGVYFYKLEVNGFADVKRMVLIK